MKTATLEGGRSSFDTSISERVRSGLAKARAQGKQLGRPKTSAETIKEIKRLRKDGKSLTQIAKQLGVSYQTVASYS